MTKTKQTAKSISEDIVNILQPDLLFEEYKAKAEGIQVLIDQAIATATQQAVEEERKNNRPEIDVLEDQASFLRSLMGIIDKPFKRDPKNMVREELIGVQRRIKIIMQALSQN